MLKYVEVPIWVRPYITVRNHFSTDARNGHQHLLKDVEDPINGTLMHLHQSGNIFLQCLSTKKYFFLFMSLAEWRFVHLLPIYSILVWINKLEKEWDRPGTLAKMPAAHNWETKEGRSPKQSKWHCDEELLGRRQHWCQHIDYQSQKASFHVPCP